MPEIMSGGAVLFDKDGDGDLDAYLIQSGQVEPVTAERQPNRMFENLGGGSFRDITEASGTGDRGYGNGGAAGDFDNDGDLDLYVTNLGPNVLYENRGDIFVDVTKQAGVAGDAWSSSAGFFDFDRDGDLDLFVTQYLNWQASTEIPCRNTQGERDYCSPSNYNSPARDVLYRNEGTRDGASVSFTDVSEEMGLQQKFGTGLGLVIGDFDGNRLLDVFVANDGMQDQLWLRRSAGGFRDDALIAGCAVDREGLEKAGMGVAAEDVDDDGDLDLLIGNLHRESDSFFENEGDGRFLDQTLLAGLGVISKPYTRFGLGLHDFDNDGFLDLFLANGRVMRHSEGLADDPYAEPNLLLRGGKGGVFARVESPVAAGEAAIRTSRAAAFGDIDNDGGIDILIVNRDDRVELLRNIVPQRGHWLLLRLLTADGRDAHHATLRVTLSDRRLTRRVNPVYSYQASNDPRIHLGLGDAEEVTDVEIEWLDGSVERFDPLKADQVIELRQSTGVRRSAPVR